MNILIVGLGVIGTTYGYLFHKAGHEVRHLIRPEKLYNIPKNIKIKMLDGRNKSSGIILEDNYAVNFAKPNTTYDFILVSISSGKIQDVINSLKDSNINGTILLFSGIWETREYINKILNGFQYIIGYPVAGGNIFGSQLDCVVFDHIMLEDEDKTSIENYSNLVILLTDSKLKAETPHDMLEWIWLHMAVNAAVISTAGKYGNIYNPSKSAENLMNSSSYLSEAVLTIRETSKIIAARNVKLKNYYNELLPYKIPSRLAGVLMKKMFQKNELTRKIMTLHNNLDDLLYVCQSVYQYGKEKNISSPRFYSNFEKIKEDLS